MTAVSNSIVTPQRLTPTDLRDAWDKARADQPMARPYDVAANLGVSELELVAARTGHDEVIRLRPDWAAVMADLGSLGEIMALTRNPSCVIEKHGTWAPFQWEAGSPAAIVHDEGIDLRLFMHAWKHLYAVFTDTPHGLRRSLQAFDGAGMALHKVFVREGADAAAVAAFDALVARYEDPDQGPGVVVVPSGALPAEKPDAEIDVAGFQEAWRTMTDTHEFFGMLRKFGVQRTQAMRLAPQFARPVDPASARRVLEHAAATGMSIMVFVGNRGCLEIHTGPIKKVKVMGPWLNVLDKGFNLHLREDHIARAWVVTKPTVDGPVTSVELFDADNQNIALLFGARKPGIAEDPNWRHFTETLG